LAAFKPIELYFGNDQPDPRSLSTTASQSYDEALQNYLVQLANPEVKTQFDSNQLAFISNYIHQIELYASEWNKLMEEHVANGDTMIVTLSGYASPLASSSYNLILSKRRINSVYQYIQKRYADALKSNQIVIIEEPFGEQNASVSNDDPVNGLNALQSRKVTINTQIKKKK
jgi:outer membrane protein OmpA-like peptidoglycan-associated protein